MESYNIPQNIKISSSRYKLHPSKFHNVLKLDSYFSRLSEQLGMQKMSYAPIIAISESLQCSKTRDDM